MSATRRHQQSALANPVLVGAMTVLVIMVAVFLAYNANQGLPFVPTRELKVDIASGSDLVADLRYPNRTNLVEHGDDVAMHRHQTGADRNLDIGISLMKLIEAWEYLIV